MAAHTACGDPLDWDPYYWQRCERLACPAPETFGADFLTMRGIASMPEREVCDPPGDYPGRDTDEALMAEVLAKEDGK